eukprot:31554-Pelagococcus_subviridis.AAC.6
MTRPRPPLRVGDRLSSARRCRRRRAVTARSTRREGDGGGARGERAPPRVMNAATKSEAVEVRRRVREKHEHERTESRGRQPTRRRRQWRRRCDARCARRARSSPRRD